jgi:hypothetical protein
MKPKPITGADLEEFRIRFGLSVGDMCYILGIARVMWNKIIRQPGVVSDPTIGMVIRLYETFPQLCPVQPAVSIDTAFKQIAKDWGKSSRSTPPLTTRDFALYAGREPTASYRWFDKDGMSQATSTPVRRLVEGLLQVPKAADFMKKLMLDESTSRGVDPVGNNTWRNVTKSKGKGKGRK